MSITDELWGEAQAIAATLGVEPDDAAMVKLHDRMNAALLEYERAQGIEKRDGDVGVVVPFVAEMHRLLEEAATLGSSNCTCNCSDSERTEIDKAAERIEVLASLAREYLHRYGTLMSLAGDDVTDETMAIDKLIVKVVGRGPTDGRP